MKRIVLIMLLIFTCAIAVAETETTQWWVNGEVYATTTCETGGDISVPTNPTKKGYTFQGWETAVYDMSTLDASINGTSYTKSNKKWRVMFSYGAVYGESLCSPTSNSEWYVNSYLDTTTGKGRYCYCRVTEFIPTGSNTIYDSAFSHWRYCSNGGEYGDNNICNLYCSKFCGEAIQNNINIRAAIYSSN